MPTTMNLFRARLLRLTGCVAASALAIVVGCAGGAAEATTRLEITDPVAQPGRPLRIWVACAPGSRLADVRSAVTRAAVLAAQPGGPWWFAAPRISAGARPGVYAVQARCTPGSGAPLAAATAPFRVSRKPQPWVAESTTAESITGDARFTPQSIAFAAGGTLPIRYLADVAGSVSVLGSSAQRAHGQLYRVLSASDLRLRADNMLCGKRPTYITIVRTAAALDADIILTIYSGSTIPRGTSSDAMCASYTYFPQPPA